MPKKYKVTILGFFVVISGLVLVNPDIIHAESASLSIDKKGNIVLDGAQVVQTAATTFFARAYWGTSFIRFTVKTDSKTIFSRNLGGPALITEIAPGHNLRVEGYLDNSSDTITVRAFAVKDLSLVDESKSFSGTVTNIDLVNKQLTIKDKSRGAIQIITATSTFLTKGGRNVEFGAIKMGDKVISASGRYDLRTTTLVAEQLSIYLDRSIFKPRNFQGTLKSIEPKGLPTAMILRISGVDYTVSLPDNVEVLNTAKAKAQIGRFLPGDTVRVYGVLQEEDENTIIAEVVRNISI